MTDSREPARVPDRTLPPADPDSETGPAEVEPGASNKPLPISDDAPEVGNPKPVRGRKANAAMAGGLTLDGCRPDEPRGPLRARGAFRLWPVESV